MPCTREKGHDWRDRTCGNMGSDDCPMHSKEITAQRVANDLHRVLYQLATSKYEDHAWSQAPLYQAVQAALMAAYVTVTGSIADARELRELMLDESGEGLWWFLDVLAERKAAQAKDDVEEQAAIAADALSDLERG